MLILNVMQGLVSANMSLPLIAGQPLDGCTGLQYAAQARGKVLLLQKGNCSYATKASLAKSAHCACMSGLLVC